MAGEARRSCTRAQTRRAEVNHAFTWVPAVGLSTRRLKPIRVYLRYWNAPPIRPTGVTCATTSEVGQELKDHVIQRVNVDDGCDVGAQTCLQSPSKQAVTPALA
jgi:hypothetical protein